MYGGISGTTPSRLWEHWPINDKRAGLVPTLPYWSLPLYIYTESQFALPAVLNSYQLPSWSLGTVRHIQNCSTWLAFVTVKIKEIKLSCRITTTIQKLLLKEELLYFHEDTKVFVFFFKHKIKFLTCLVLAVFGIVLDTEWAIKCLVKNSIWARHTFLKCWEERKVRNWCRTFPFGGQFELNLPATQALNPRLKEPDPL